jgi:lysozyme family protein
VQQEWKIDNLVDALIEREGGYVRHPADRGGPTCFGITETVARAHGYAGPMRQLPRSEAAAIYRRLYWERPRFDRVAERSAALAAELFDTGVNMGPSVAVTFLQRALTALNRNGRDYPDLVPDGRIGERTLAALDAFLEIRPGKRRDRPPQGPRSAARRTLPAARRTPSCQRSVPLWLAREPNW